MNRISTFSKYILLIGILIFSIDSYAQCTTEIRAVRDTIACGESLLLENITLSNSPTSDNFSGSTLGGLWASPGTVSSGWTLTSSCGATPSGQNLWFAQGAVIPRNATTTNIDASCGGTICFDFRMETQSAPPCDGPDQANEAIYVQYRNNTTGGAWTTFQTFLPGAAFTGWNNYCYPIPVGATAGGPGNLVQFRWIQFNASTPTFDLWGIDNVDISLNPPCGIPYITTFFGPNVPVAYTLDTITVTPYTDSAIYSVFVSNGTLSCTDSITVYVEQPSIVSQLLTSACAGSDTLDAQATITANCDYTLELLNYNPSGATTGWGVGGSSPPSYHNLDVNVDGSLYSNFTMATGAHGASISFPIAVTDGDLLETYFTSLGGNANECVYRIYDSQGNVANTGAGNPAYTGVGGTPSPTYFNTHLMFNIINGGAGYNSAPYSVGNPAPIITLSGGGCTVDTIYVNNVTFGTGIINSIISRYNGITNAATGCTSPPTITVTGGGGAGAIITATLVDDAVHVTCPATATYNYSWTNITSGGVAGLSNPNIQSPLATVSTLTQFQVTAYDSLHPLCIAIDTVTVNGNAGLGTFDFAITSTNPICNDGTVTTVDFSISSSTISSGNFTFDIVDGNGTIINPTPIPFNSIPFTGTINLPTPIVAGNYSYGITNVLDAIGCPVAVNQPNPITFIINDPPNAGTYGAITVCTADPIFDLFSQLNGTPQMGGTWTNSLNVQVGAFYFPSTSPSDVFTYTLNGISPCPNDFSTVTVTNNALPDPGQNASHTVCQNDPAFNMENFLGGTPQTGGSWVDASGNSVSNGMFDPSTMSAGVYTYTVTGLSPCPNRSANLNVTVDALPTAAISTTTPTICDGNSATLNFTFTGTAPFDVTYNDGVNPSITTTINSTTGTATLNPTSTTVYTLVSVLDANGCSSAVSGSVTITVTPGPNAGTPGSRSTCESSPAFDLFLELGGTADVGGSWTESGNSVSNMFNPSTYGAGVFTLTYTITSPPCLPVSEDVTVTVNPLVSAGTNGSNIVCENDSNFNLFNFLNGSPDVGGSWVDASGNSVSNGMFDPSTMSAGVYTYTVLGTPPCIDATATVTVTVNPLPTVTINGTTTITQGQSTPINFTFTGTAPYTVVYDDGTGPITSPSFNSNTGTINVSPNATTVYTLVSVTDANGCITNTSGSITITVNQLPTVTLSGTATICTGQNTDLDFNLGGSPNFTVEYNVNGVLTSYVFNSTGSNPLNVNPVITTTYTLVSITDGNGIIDNNVSGSVTITVNPLPTAVLSGDNTICDGTQTPLNFALTGAADYTLTYNPGNIAVSLDANGNDVSTGSPVIVNPTSTTSYSIVSIVDANTCTNIGSGSATITVNPLPNMQIIGTAAICAGQSATIGFTPTGTAPFNLNYLVNGTATNVTLDAAGTISGTPLSVTPSSTTTYTLVDVTDANCPNPVSGSITITVNPLPTATMSGSTSICIGQSTPLDFNFTGTGPYNINYDIDITPTSAVLSNNIDSIVVSPTSTTTYTLIDVTDANCTNSANGTVVVTVNPLPSANISGGATICADGSTAQIDITAAGTAPFNVIYSDGFNATPLNGISSPYNFQTNTAGNYTLISVTDFNGCDAVNISGVATVVVNPLPVASFSFMPQPIDINNPTVYFTDLSSGHVSGIYDFGDGITAPTVLLGQLQHTYIDTGSFQVLYSVTSADGCVASVGHTIIIDPAFLIYIPTGFTPNRDGKNDDFIPIMMGIDEYDFYIYDRFGELVFETENQLEGWNGRVNGREFALAGHYAYTVKIIDMLGKKRDFTGTLTLIR